MSGGEIVALPGGFTIQRVAPGLFEWTRADAAGVVAGLADLADLQRIVDGFGHLAD